MDNMITNNEYQNALDIVKKYREQCVLAIAEIDKNIDKHYELRNTKIKETFLSVRALNVLFHNNFNLNRYTSLVKDLSNVSRFELTRCRNIGKKTLDEIDDLCAKANILMKP